MDIFALAWFLVSFPAAGGADQAVVAHGVVRAPRGSHYVVVHRAYQLRFRYARGWLRLIGSRERQFRKAKKVFLGVGRFASKGIRRGRVVVRFEFDLPGAAMTKWYTKRDLRLLQRMDRALTTQATVLVPWHGPLDRLVVRDKWTGKQYVFRLRRRRAARARGAHKGGG